ncbi:MAG: antibiotic biosynthesis monooxygenase [Alphaproteobacteria bacterium]|nr:antibiotic biosynthesis monooxygenase [Alphaproteobacteria bacterium]
MTLLLTAHLKVHEDVLEAFAARLRRNAGTSVEAGLGCHRFGAHRERGEPSLCFLIEVYADAATPETHRQSVDYEAFREDEADWVADRQWWLPPSAEKRCKTWVHPI